MKIIKILTFDRNKNILIFMLQNLFVAFLSLNLFSYKFIIDYFLNQIRFEEFIPWLLICLFSLLFSILLQWILTFLKISVTRKTYKLLQETIITNLSNQTYLQISKQRNKTVALFNDYLESSMLLLEVFHNYLFKFISSFVIPLIFMFVLNQWSWIIFLTIIFSQILIFIFFLIIVPNFQQKFQNLMQKYEEYAQKQVKTFSLFSVFYFFNKINIFNKLIFKNTENVFANNFKFKLKTDWANSVATSISFLFTGVGIAEIAVLIYYKFIDISNFLSLLSYLIIISSAFSLLFNSIFPLITYTPTLVKILEENKEIKKYKYEEIDQINTITIKDLSYKTDEKTIIFDKLNLEIIKNKKYAIIGESGTGKSTLLKLIANLDENYEGSIFINNEIDLKDLNPKNTLKNIGLINNQNTIFNDTFLNNIVMWDENPDLEKVNKLIEEFKIKKLELDEKFDENSLSEGEKQRLILARLKYDDFDIWCLDEALDNIEKEFSKQIWTNILQQDDKTILAISHHFEEEILNQFDEVIRL
ncbi:ATP-binding cassette domain-containing protein [Mycoplasma sp. 1654_15]|uniref:ATP-binding cassette domain-containing protein n=1 Tax=Mycoplasma sp. 1654_15 TaxID=2725994 RepID=UPI001448FC73|nr:ABC transporter ATP-binding protein/permease [Mycoplasma sp. 1654_15]QJB71233.1 ABC transporter ATP-binding protein [Mycoplasma sp. 1654_15]